MNEPSTVLKHCGGSNHNRTFKRGPIMDASHPTTAGCETCGNPFNPRDNRRAGRFCSHPCYMKSRPRITLVCQVCKKTFDVMQSSKQMYCSNACRSIVKSQDNSVEQSCEVCGKRFMVQRCETGKRFCCSRECRWKRLKGRPHKRPHREAVSLQCETCTKTFMHPNTLRKYCSNTCRKLAPGNKVVKTCGYCGKIFHVHECETKRGPSRGQYCSRHCYTIAIASADNRTLARGACDRCGWKEQPAILQIHHKDGNRKHGDYDNLELLCPNCHMLHHYETKTGPFRAVADKIPNRKKTIALYRSMIDKEI